jgi:outer membrane biosynthesis protein TonB
VDLDAAADGLDAAADALYALPRDEFTPARDDRVRAAKAAGDKSLAGQLGKLRRPTVAAWLVNNLARRRPEELAELAALGETMRTAHQRLDGPALRRLSEQRRELVNALGRSIRELAGAAGEEVSDAVGRELDGMLSTALADPAATRALASGRLSSPKELASAATLDWPAVAPGARPLPPPTAEPTPATPKGADPAPAATSAKAAPRPAAAPTPSAAPAPAADAAPADAPTPEPTPAPGPNLALARARQELDRLAAALADAEDRATAAQRDHETAAAEEAEAHRAVADRRAELIAAEATEQQARQRARAARRAREDTDRTLRDAVRRHGVARDRLAALED